MWWNCFFLWELTNINFQVNLTQLGVKDGPRKTGRFEPKKRPGLEDDGRRRPFFKNVHFQVSRQFLGTSCFKNSFLFHDPSQMARCEVGISNISTARWSKLIGPNPRVSTRLKASPKTCSQLSILSICSLNRGRKLGFLWPTTREAIYFKVFLGDYSTVFFLAQGTPVDFFFQSQDDPFKNRTKKIHGSSIEFQFTIPKTNINP